MGQEALDMALDYKMKGLPIDIRQRLFDHMTREISETMMEWFLEKDDGYPALHDCGFSDGDIQLVFEAYAEKFERANRYMTENGRPPLFSNPHDAHLSAKEYVELMKRRTDEELIDMFGSTLEEAGKTQ